MSLVMIDYGMGNLRNVQKAFAKVGAPIEITSDPQKVAKAKGIVLPGVGAVRDAMKALKTNHMDEQIKASVSNGIPLLGICLGMQLLFEFSEENDGTEMLGILPGRIVKLEVPYKVPHMGWNTLEITKQAPLFKGIECGSYVYFVHSYYLEGPQEVVSAYTEYGKKIAIAAQKDRVFATQFHPEKSDQVGLKILENFLGEVEK